MMWWVTMPKMSAFEASRIESSWDRELWLYLEPFDPKDDRYIRLIRPRERNLSSRELTAGYVFDHVDGRSASVYDLVAGEWVYYDELNSISPFLLLRDGESGSQTDLQRIESEMTARRGKPDFPFGFMLPDEAVLLAELDSKNPWVREAATRLIVAGGERRYPQASWVVRQRE